MRKAKNKFVELSQRAVYKFNDFEDRTRRIDKQYPFDSFDRYVLVYVWVCDFLLLNKKQQQQNTHNIFEPSVEHLKRDEKKSET